MYVDLGIWPIYVDLARVCGSGLGVPMYVDLAYRFSGVQIPGSCLEWVSLFRTFFVILLVIPVLLLCYY